jgi:hypothetical protein
VVLAGDFHACTFERRFDIVTYWSGFGLGPQSEHGPLLAQIRDWLVDGGVALIDVFEPDWWRRRSGEVQVEHGVGQRIEYDETTGCLIDVWWSVARPVERVEEKIRCYSTAEFSALLESAGLAMVETRPSLGSADPPSYLAISRRQ